MLPLTLQFRVTESESGDPQARYRDSCTGFQDKLVLRTQTNGLDCE